MFNTLLLLLPAFAGDPLNLREKIEPLDLMKGGKPFPITAIHQIESDGKHLFLRSLRETQVVETDTRGNVVRIIGREGPGPGEWGEGGIMAIALGDGELWGYGTHNRTMNGYRNQVFTGGFSIDKVTPGLFGTTSNTFGVSQKHLVVPSPFRTSFLAEIFSKTGESLGPLGEPLETNPEILKRNPVVNDTLWQHHGNSWLALFKFFPVLAVFDRNFQPVTQIGLNDPWIDTGFKKLISEGFDSSIPPLFSDFKIFENRIYLMCRGKLLQLDAKTGETLSRTTFFGEGLDFGKVAGEPLSFPFFTFLADGSLVLAHPMLLWNHDLWTTKPPSHRKAASGAGR